MSGLTPSIGHHFNTIDQFTNQVDKEATILFRDYCSKILMYLFWVTSGGSIAILGFMGACKAARTSMALKLCLGFFIAGLLCVGASYALLLLGISRVKDAGHIDRELRSKLDRAYWPGVASFACIIIAVIFGAFGIISLDDTDKTPDASTTKQVTLYPTAELKSAPGE